MTAGQVKGLVKCEIEEEEGPQAIPQVEFFDHESRWQKDQTK